MSDSEDSTVTYTEVSSPFEDLSDIGSPGVVRPEYEGLPWMLDDPYVQPVYPKFMPPEDEVIPAEEQPLPAAASPTADSPGYVPESDPKEDPEEDDDEDPEEDPADYPADRGDDGDDKVESSDDEDDNVDIEGETEPFETDESAATPPPHPAYRVTARISIQDEPATPFWYDTEVAQTLALLLLYLPSPSFPSSWSSTDYLHLHSPSTTSPRSKAPPSETPPLLPIPLPTPSPPLLPPSTDRGADERIGPRPTRGFKADYGFVATMDREVRRDLERDVGYEITDTCDEMLVDMPGALANDDTKLGRRMTEFTTRVRQDTYEIYTRLYDEQTERQLMVGQLNMLYKDRRAYARTALLMEREARMSREAWG
ncbi:hypothetical protein Tco_0507875 [Tanacetum coccineum]